MTATAKTIEMVPATTGDAPATPSSVVIMPDTEREVTPLSMLDRALRDGKDLATLEKFMDLQDRYERNQARRAFNEAFAAFKSEAIKIIRNKLVTDGPLKGKRYAELFSFVDAATPALSANGLSASWSITRDEKDWIEVTCTIEHILGGSKQVSLGGPPDTGGAKNALQARISTVTYLERATFKAACGLAEQGDDDDGKAAGPPAVLSEDQLKELQDYIDQNDLAPSKILTKLGVASLEEIPAKEFDRLMTMLRAFVAERAKKGPAK